MLEFSCVSCMIFFCKQKTAYEMRIRDWSSDGCSSDLILPPGHLPRRPRGHHCPSRQPRTVVFRFKSRCGHGADRYLVGSCAAGLSGRSRAHTHAKQPYTRRRRTNQDRKRVEEGESAPVRVRLGGRRIMTKTDTNITTK